MQGNFLKNLKAQAFNWPGFEGFIVRRPYDCAGSVRHLLGLGKMIVVVVVYLFVVTL